MTLVKICGITGKKDALLAAGFGVDAIGVVNVRGSKRFTELQNASEIFRILPPFISRVLVCSPSSMGEIRKIEEVHADCVQLHGDESLEFIEEIRENSDLIVIKQIPVTGNESMEQARLYSDLADAILLDTKADGETGGTGKTHDWYTSREIVSSVKKPVILAGGLNPDNVADAVRKVKPYAVDVATGVEKEPGIKDPDKVKRFIQNATK